MKGEVLGTTVKNFKSKKTTPQTKRSAVNKRNVNEKNFIYYIIIITQFFDLSRIILNFFNHSEFFKLFTNSPTLSTLSLPYSAIIFTIALPTITPSQY